MRIQTLSQKTGISKRNIHYYIKENLLTPKADDGNGYYAFSDADYQRLLIIKHLRGMGLSISTIKALLNNPASAEYYFRMQIGFIEQQISELSSNSQNLQLILKELPVNPNYSDLSALLTKEELYSNTSPPLQYDGKLVNHFLWRSFWQKETLSEYQQFLWEKINRLTDAREKNEHYTKLYDYLCSQSQNKIDALYQERNSHFKRIAALSEEEVVQYAEEMKQNIQVFIHTPAAVRQWKEHYDAFLLPQMYIFTGEIGQLAKEMSPFFSSYRNHSAKACELVFQWLHSIDGHKLLEEIHSVLDGYIHLEEFGHAELESMNTIFKY